MFLTDEELRELTKRTRRDAQARVLKFMGIEHGVRPDGSLAVLSSHVETLLSGGAMPPKLRPVEPDWSGLSA